MRNNKDLIIEKGAIARASELLAKNDIHGKLIYVSDSFVDGLYGDKVRSQLDRFGTVNVELVENNTISYAMALAEKVISTDVTCIVGLGGGKVLDVCKYAAYVSKVPFLSIPTTLANDGIASPIAVLKRADNKPKSLGAAMPRMLLIDTDVINESPVALIKAGIGDTISNYLALMDWDLAVSRGKDTMSGYAYMMSKSSLDGLMKTQYDSICPEFIEVLINSLVLSGLAMDFAGSSRPVSGAEHLFSHALDYYGTTPNLHGIQVALGTISVLKLISEDYSILLDYLRRFEVDINPLHLGIDEDTFVKCLSLATTMRTSRYTCLDETDLGENRLRNLYRELVEELSV